MLTKEEYSKNILDKCVEGTILISKYINSKTPIQVKCINNHVRNIIPSNIITRGSGSTCKECEGINIHGKKTTSTFITDLLNKHTDLNLIGEYTGAFDIHKFKCINNHIFESRPNAVLAGKTCVICHPTHRIDTKTQEEFTKDLSAFNIKLIGKYINAKTYVEVEYSCGHRADIFPTNLISHNTRNICRECFPILSKVEIEVFEFIKNNYDGWIVQHDKSILGTKELDIVLPDLGVAIEFNGVYWHSSKFSLKNSTYHINKTIGVETFGYRLIHIREDEWIKKKDIVKSRLLSILGKNTVVYARNTTVRKIDYPSSFLDENHMMGKGSPTKENYGLFLKEELVAVMTFSTRSFSNNRICDYELVRFCSLTGVTVVGGASKLLKRFKKDNPNKSIISYSDKRWSIGNLYKKLGFEYHHTSSPGYTYFKNLHSLSRYSCYKENLPILFPNIYVEGMGEEETLNKAGYYKVFDCGNDVWILK